MLKRFYAFILAVCLLCLAVEAIHAQQRRREIGTFSATDQFELRQLIIAYLTANTGVIPQHLTSGIHCSNEFFLSWHRGYLADLEAWLMTQNNGTKYVPLPKWYPKTTPIPNAFFNSLVLPGRAIYGSTTTYPNLITQNLTTFPTSNFDAFQAPGVCATYTAGSQTRACTGFSPGTAADNFAKAVEDQHDNVHAHPSYGIRGSMGAVNTAPAAAIFFLWHGFVDDLYRYYQCQCQSIEGKDLYMKDDPNDVANEPNTTAPGGVLWNSPDIWVRQNADLYNALTQKYANEDNINRHQNPEYKLSGNNYIYVRIRNTGCQTVSAGEVKLRVYWSKYSAGSWTWPANWTTLPSGQEITVAPISVPTLAPGAQWVAEVPWVVPNPALYPLDPNHFCLLARLESLVDPMAVAEGLNVYTNVQNNNNIAWKNVMVYDTDPFNIVSPTTFNKFFAKLISAGAVKAGFKVNYAKNPAMHVELDLGTELGKIWEQHGKQGTGIEYLGEYKVRVNEPGATIDGLYMTADVAYKPAVLAYVSNAATGNYGDAEYDKTYPVDISQTEYDAQGKATEVGGVTVEVRTARDPDISADLVTGAQITGTTCPQEPDGAIALTVNENAAGQTFTYWWSNGAHTRDISGLTAGEYSVVVRNSDGLVDTRTYVVPSNSTLKIEMDGELTHCGGANGKAMVAVGGGEEPYTYAWSRDGEDLPNETEETVLNATAGTYKVTVTDASGCSVTGAVAVGDEWNMLQVWVGTTPASGEDVPDGTAEVYATGMPPFTYQWSNGATTALVEGLAPGTYWVDVTDMMGCLVRKDFTITYQQGLQGVERGNTVLANTTVVPNPASGTAELRYRLQRPGIVQVDLYDNLGRRIDVLFGGQLSVGEQTLRVETAGLTAGQYTLRIISGEATTTVPLVVIH